MEDVWCDLYYARKQDSKSQRNLSQVLQLGAHVLEFLDVSPSHYWLPPLYSCGMMGKTQTMMSDLCGFK